MVKPLRAGKSARRGRPSDTSAEIYKRYLALPPWPVPWAMDLDVSRSTTGARFIGAISLGPL
jgi:hypothetical protein